MKIHAVLHGSTVNGPGIRSVVWTQGCTLACPGCWNPKTHSFDGGQTIEPLDLARRVVAEAEPGTEGITLSGGEPLQQAPSVLVFCQILKAKRPDWSIGLFTGYYPEELKVGHYGQDPDFGRYSFAIWEHSLRPLIDFAVMGRYDRSRPTDPELDGAPIMRMCSSSNQRLHLFTTRYSYDHFGPLAVEYNIGPDGETTFTGFPVKA